MKDDLILSQLATMAEPRDLSTLPEWADPVSLDSLIDDGLITFSHLQRTKGLINLIMGIRFTPKAKLILKSRFEALRRAGKSVAISGTLPNLLSGA